MTIPTYATLPAKTDSDLGRPKSGEPAADLDRDVAISELEAIKSWIVALGAVLGTNDDPDLDTVLERLLTLEAGGGGGGLTDASFPGTDAAVLVRTGSGTYSRWHYKVDATTAPTASDDKNNTNGTGNFAVGSLWIDATNRHAYICTNNDTAGAVWRKVAIPTASTPAAVGTAAVGTSTDFARADHVHALPSATAPISVSAGVISIGDASDTAKGAVELATSAECITGTDTARAVTPAAMRAAIDQGIHPTVASKSANFTLSNDDRIVHIDSSGGAVSITLPAASKRSWLLKKVGSGTNKITLLHGSVSIEGAASDLDLPGSTSAPTSTAPLVWMLYSDGTNWFWA